VFVKASLDYVYVLSLGLHPCTALFSGIAFYLAVMCVGVCMFVLVFAPAHMHMYVCMHACMPAYMHVCQHTCMYVCMSTGIHLYTCVPYHTTCSGVLDSKYHTVQASSHFPDFAAL